MENLNSPRQSEQSPRLANKRQISSKECSEASPGIIDEDGVQDTCGEKVHNQPRIQNNPEIVNQQDPDKEITISVEHNDEIVVVKIPVRQNELGSNILKLSELLDTRPNLATLGSTELSILRDGYEGMFWAANRREQYLKNEIQKHQQLFEDDPFLIEAKKEIDCLYEIQVQHTIILRKIKLQLDRPRPEETGALWYTVPSA